MARYVWLLIFVISGIVNAQPAVEWERTIGPYQSDWFFCAVQTGDGGYIVGGGQGSWGGEGTLVRLNANGDSLWSRSYPGMGEIYSGIATTDGNFVWSSYYSYGVMKTNADGDTLWTRNQHCTAYTTMCACADSGFALAGQAGLFRISDNGDSVFCHSYAVDYPCDSIRGIVPTSDGGFLLMGYVARPIPPPENSTFAFRVNEVGDVLWSRYYSQSVSRILPVSGIEIADGGFLVARGTEITKLDSSGDTLSTRQINAFSHHGITRMKTSWDGNLLLAGDYCTLVKATMSGNVLWSQTFNASPGDYCANVIQTADGGFLCTSQNYNSGNGRSSVVVVKLASETPSGRMALNHTSLTFTMHQQDDSVSMPLIVQSTGTHPLRVASLATTAEWYTLNVRGPFWLDPGTDTTIWVTCHRRTGPGDLAGTLWILSNDSLPGNGAHRLRLEVSQIDGSVSEPSELPTRFQLFPSYPNPFNPSTTIAFDLPKTEFVSLKVFDLMGREVAVLNQGVVAAGHYTLSFDGSALPSGIYFYRMQAGEYSAINRMLLLK